jgi:predicted ATP-dependent protease
MEQTALELDASRIVFSIPEERVSMLREQSCSTSIIGQDRAISALELGLGIKADGYNVFIMGASGTGRRTVLTSLLANYKANPSDLQDMAYVYNFARPLEPRALFFPAGSGAYFKKTLKSAIESIRRQVLQLSKSEVFAAASKKISAAADQEENKLLSDFEQTMLARGFKLVQVKDDDARSMDLIPLLRGKPIAFDDLQELAARGKVATEAVNALREDYYASLDMMADLFATIKDIRKATDRKIRALKAESAGPIIENELAVLKSLCRNGTENAAVLEHLEAVKEDLLSKVHVYGERFRSGSARKAFFDRYAINLVCESAPGQSHVVQEEVPTFANLFGSIEPSGPNDDFTINGHMRLRPGSVHRASGGFLILRLQDLLLEEGAWPYLKRVLQSGKAEIQTPPTGNHLPSLLKPQPLPVRVKAILIGGEHSYDFLYQEDPDFQKLFKVCAEFDSVMPATDDNLKSFISFALAFSKQQGTLPLDDSGLARIIAFSARIAEDRTLLTTRFTRVSDLILEADFFARSKNATVISREMVSGAIEHRRYLQRLPEEKYASMIRSREIVLEVTGTMTGKVNGLAVQDRGYQAFGIPVAVTAQAAPGTSGVINIERESGLSGEIYDKAHLIIQAYCTASTPLTSRSPFRRAFALSSPTRRLTGTRPRARSSSRFFRRSPGYHSGKTSP